MTALDQQTPQRLEIRGGIEIHYVEAGDGLPLVFVHGGMGDWSSWAPQWEAFASDFRCITYSRRFSSPNRNVLDTTSHSVIEEAQDLSALLDGWDASPAILVGTSYGAYTALQLALMHPGKVRALAVTEPPVLPFADLVEGGREARMRFEQEVLDPATDAFADGRPEDAMRMLTDGINGNGSGEATTEAGRQRRLRNAEAMRALAISSLPYPPLSENALKRMTIPTLLLHGVRTLPVHRATTTALAGLMPHAQLIGVADSGHGVHRDNPASFNAIVLDFVSSVTREKVVAMPDPVIAAKVEAERASRG